MKSDALLIVAIVPFALVVNLARDAADLPANWGFVALQIALLAIQIIACALLYLRSPR